jgi:hypothetical protein
MVIYHTDGERKKEKQGRDWKETGNELKIQKKEYTELEREEWQKAQKIYRSGDR